MAFCQNIGRTLYKAMHDVDEKILSVADEVILITGKLKNLQHSPTIQMIEAALGIGAPVLAWIDKALEIAYNIEITGKTLAEKLKEFLDAQPTQIAVEGVLAKVAGVATKIGDARNKPDHVADQAVTIALARNKAA